MSDGSTEQPAHRSESSHRKTLRAPQQLPIRDTLTEEGHLVPSDTRLVELATDPAGGVIYERDGTGAAVTCP